MNSAVAPPPVGMSLDALADQYLIGVGGYRDPFRIEKTKVFHEVHLLTRSEPHTESTLASIFWQIYSLSGNFRRYLQRFDVLDQSLSRPTEFVVVGHGEQGLLRYDLLILHPATFSPDPEATVTEVSPHAQLDVAFAKWHRIQLDSISKFLQEGRINLETLSFYEKLLDRVDLRSVYEIRNTLPLGMMILNKPRTEPMRVPRPAWGIAPDEQPTSTAGVLVSDKLGRFGVTACLHGVEPDRDRYKTLLGRRVEVLFNGLVVLGTVLDFDQITDSCFIELELSMQPSQLRQFIDSHAPLPPSQPLMDVCPRHMSPAWFWGLSSGKKDTVVSSHSLELPWVSPYLQSRVYTPAVTSPGDSGAALVDQSDDAVLGFCFERTGVGESIQYSSWIWAHSVYAAMDLHPLDTNRR